MKTTFTKLGALTVLMTLIFTTLFIGCKSDNDTPNDSTLCDTFLECNNAISWKYIGLEDNVEIARIYFKLNNNKSNPVESWLTFSTMDCYEVIHISEHQFQIIENTKDRFIIKITWQDDYWEQDEFETWTFTKQGESLKLVQKYFVEEIILISSKTSDNIADLQICVD